MKVLFGSVVIGRCSGVGFRILFQSVAGSPPVLKIL